MKGNLEADYILYLDGKAIAVLEAKREENKLGLEVAEQAQNYGNILPNWVQDWKTSLPFIFLCNGDLLLFKDMREEKPSYKVLKKMFTPKNNKHDFGKQKYSGVGGYLFAIAADKSVQWGYEGAMHGFALNRELLEHYMETFHAEFLGMLHDYQFFINENNAKKLLEVYNYEWN